MAKRDTGVEKKSKSRSRKTKKRLAIKREMLASLKLRRSGLTKKADRKRRK